MVYQHNTRIQGRAPPSALAYRKIEATNGTGGEHQTPATQHRTLSVSCLVTMVSLVLLHGGRQGGTGADGPSARKGTRHIMRAARPTVLMPAQPLACPYPRPGLRLCLPIDLPCWHGVSPRRQAAEERGVAQWVLGGRRLGAHARRGTRRRGRLPTFYLK